MLRCLLQQLQQGSASPRLNTSQISHKSVLSESITTANKIFSRIRRPRAKRGLAPELLRGVSQCFVAFSRCFSHHWRELLRLGERLRTTEAVHLCTVFARSRRLRFAQLCTHFATFPAHCRQRSDPLRGSSRSFGPALSSLLVNWSPGATAHEKTKRICFCFSFLQFHFFFLLMVATWAPPSSSFSRLSCSDCSGSCCHLIKTLLHRSRP